jgi:hypothetical protein
LGCKPVAQEEVEQFDVKASFRALKLRGDAGSLLIHTCAIGKEFVRQKMKKIVLRL